MPNMNGTGPQGQGPMTGRRMGRCANKGADTKKPADAASDNHNENTNENLPGRGPGSGSGRAEREQEEAEVKVWDDKTASVVVVKTWKVPLPSF